MQQHSVQEGAEDFKMELSRPEADLIIESDKKLYVSHIQVKNNVFFFFFKPRDISLRAV